MVTPSSVIATSLSTDECWAHALTMCCTGSLLRRTARWGTCKGSVPYLNLIELVCGCMFEPTGACMLAGGAAICFLHHARIAQQISCSSCSCQPDCQRSDVALTFQCSPLLITTYTAPDVVPASTPRDHRHKPHTGASNRSCCLSNKDNMMCPADRSGASGDTKTQV